MRNDEDKRFRSAGLCFTCDNVSFCGHRTLRGFDAQYCELFDNSSWSATGTDSLGKHTLPSAEKGDRPVIREAIKLKGLCLNCAIRETCMLPRPIEGVWHCEEYQ